MGGSSLRSEKEKFSRMLAQKEYSSRRAYVVTVVLFVCILVLGAEWLLRRYGE
jgi:hypothetical protein